MLLNQWCLVCSVRKWRRYFHIRESIVSFISQCSLEVMRCLETWKGNTAERISKELLITCVEGIQAHIEIQFFLLSFFHCHSVNSGLQLSSCYFALFLWHCHFRVSSNNQDPPLTNLRVSRTILTYGFHLGLGLSSVYSFSFHVKILLNSLFIQS